MFYTQRARRASKRHVVLSSAVYIIYVCIYVKHIARINANFAGGRWFRIRFMQNGKSDFSLHEFVCTIRGLKIGYCRGEIEIRL